jgi:hypothetical protein
MTVPLLPEYRGWLDRVAATYSAVAYTCAHRLGDRELGAAVGARVVAGLLARPTVFQYFGLPYSGRIAHLAEDLIARAAAGGLSAVDGWPELSTRLGGVPAEHQRVLVLTCVQGCDDAELAAALGCAQDEARRRRAGTLTHFRELVATCMPPTGE